MPITESEANEQELTFLLKQQQHCYEQRARYSDATGNKGRVLHKHYDDEYHRYETLIKRLATICYE